MKKLNTLKNTDKLFITDIGSTTTKGLLLTKNNSGKWQFTCQADAYTTVEKPHEDVNIGLKTCQKALAELAIKKGLDLPDFNEIPYLTTSSAGGGLQMVSMGLTKKDTGKLAEMTVLDAVGVLLKSFSVDDGIKDFQKVKIIRNLHPDMILLAGGYNGGTNYGILHYMTLLNEAAPQPRFTKHLKTPLVYCGNETMNGFIDEFLEERFETFLAPNIRPDETSYNIAPAKELVHNIFKEKVMQRAPGFSVLAEKVAHDVLPTPTAVEKMIDLYAEQEKCNLLLVDMGGATTDIYASLNGDFQRTVAANVGLSYSMANIMALLADKEDFSLITNSLPESLKENQIRNYAYNKTINPAYLPQTKAEYLIEQVCAQAGFELAWKQHQKMNFNPVKEAKFETHDSETAKSLVNFFRNPVQTIKDAVAKSAEKVKLTYYEESYKLLNNNRFKLSELDVIIGSGGVIAYAGSDLDRIQMLTDGFKPWGITRLDIDRPFKVSHLGLLSEIDSDLALNLFTNTCVKPLAYVVAPFGVCSQEEIVLEVFEEKNRVTTAVKYGEVKYFSKGGNFTFTTKGQLFFKGEVDKVKLETALPVLIDCRGRGKYFNGKTLYQSGFNNTGSVFYTTEIPANKNLPESFKDKIFEREYIHNAMIFPKNEQKLEADEVIAVHTVMNPKKFVVDLPKGFGGELTSQVLQQFLKVKIGDKIPRSGRIFFADTGELNRNRKPIEIKSNRNGKLLKITKRGVLIFEEYFENSDKNLLEGWKANCTSQLYSRGSEGVEIIDLCKKMRIDKEVLSSYIKIKKGQFLTAGEVIADKYSMEDLLKGADDLLKKWVNPKLDEPVFDRTIRAKSTGQVVDFDFDTGLLYFMPGLKRENIRAQVKGRFAGVDQEKKAILINVFGSSFEGRIGFGGENNGILT